MLTISFGNLSINQFEKRANTKFNEEDKKWLEEHRTDLAKGEKGKFHIFDKPFKFVTCKTISGELITILSKYNEKKEFTEDVNVECIEF